MDALDWCRQRMLVSGNPLTASLPFAEPSRRDAILALRTAVSELASIAGEVDERSVAEAKLNWWRQAFREPENTHPALQALRQAGVIKHVSADDFDALVSAVEATLDPPRFENTSQAWAFFRRIGGQVSQLEAQLLDDACSVSGGPDLADLGAAAYFVRVTRDLTIDARANRWLVPLDLQADFQVSRQDALAARSSRSFDGLIRAMLAEAHKRGERARLALTPDQARTHRHLLILWALDRRLASLIARRPQRIFERRLLPGHAGNVWAAWREARRLKKLS